IEWGATLPAILAAPPDAENVGEAWQAQWEDRLDKLSFPLEKWISKKTRGDYWRHGSVKFSADRFNCPVLSIGGWSDRYSNSVMALAILKPDLCWGVVGPWGHHYPDQGEPGPAVNFQKMALEWWDHWLMGSGDEPFPWPKLQLWRREFDPPQDRLTARHGEWISISSASPRSATHLYLGRGSLELEGQGIDSSLSVPFNLQHGTQAGDTGYFGRVGGLPLDQADDDQRALCFQSAPLVEAISLIGCAELDVLVARTTNEGQLVCRICDVSPDGRSNLVTRTILNLQLDETLDGSTQFKPEVPQRYSIKFPSTAYRFKPTNRIRLAIGSSYWPLVWPPSEPTELKVTTANAKLILPNANTHPVQPIFDMVPFDAGAPVTLQRTNASTEDGRLTASWQQAPTQTKLDEIGVSLLVETSMTYQVELSDPAKAQCEAVYQLQIHKFDTQIDIESKATIAVEAGKFVGENSLSIVQDQRPILDRLHKLIYF
ncbi:MAG: CocE/NonD family hydrolase C-terminal non-catalytic domain-containing protein, partial [Pseudomonadota bacterium]